MIGKIVLLLGLASGAVAHAETGSYPAKPEIGATGATAKTAAAKPYAGADLSGVYACTGQDAHDGGYKATVTLTLDRANSTAGYAGYRFKMEVEGYGLYLGSAAAKGDMMAITFGNEDPAKKDYGTGIATLRKKQGAWSFEKFYFQPEYASGNHGMEYCTRKAS